MVACCRRQEAAGELRRAADREEALIRIENLDVTDSSRIFELAADPRHLNLDILFNNAGQPGPDQQEFGQSDDAEWLDAFKVNTTAPFPGAAS